MAFLDNSGDIILDAVLTELGRKRLADGDFQILKFGLGDDEINYGTYDLSHPSGSAYYDHVPGGEAPSDVIASAVCRSRIQDQVAMAVDLVSRLRTF